MGACQSSHLLQKDPDWRQYVDQEWKSQRAKVLDRALGACVGCAGGKHMPQKLGRPWRHVCRNVCCVPYSTFCQEGPPTKDGNEAPAMTDMDPIVPRVGISTNLQRPHSSVQSMLMSTLRMLTASTSCVVLNFHA
eukprot:1158961-Pelagomonas_calceolata.AAC.1